MKQLKAIVWLAFLMVGLFSTAHTAEISIHGDLNHRFQYTNHADFLTLDSSSNRPEINNGSVDENFGEIKYRLWMDAATNDGKVKGVVATVIGGLRFGESSKADFSGDDIQFEVRWAYADIQCPVAERKARLKIGLQPFKVNPFIWQETVAGVALNSTMGDTVDYQVSWMRGREVDKTAAGSDENDDRTDVDALVARFDCDPGGSLKGGVFGMYQFYDADGANNGVNGALDSRDYQIKSFGTNKGIDLFSIGVDGQFNPGPFFINWDVIYQTGEIEDTAYTDFASGTGNSGDFDVSAYFIHLDVGTSWKKFKFKYTFWYASGDDNPTDSDFNAFISTDVDITDSICLFEGNYADDNYFTERPYIADKGFIMNRFGLDYPATKKCTVGGAAMYMLLAEDVTYTAAATSSSVSSDELGIEFDVYAKYMMYPNLEIAWSAGYLVAGDALDVYEAAAIQDGSADEDIFITSARVRYKF